MDEKASPEPVGATLAEFRADEDERVLIGSCVRWPEIVPSLRERVRSDAFFQAGPRQIFAAIEALDDRGELPIWTSVIAELRRRGAGRDILGGSSLLEWADLAVSPHWIEWHAFNVLAAAQKRRLHEAGGRVSATAEDTRLSADDAVKHAQEIVAGVATKHRADSEIYEPFALASLAVERNARRTAGQEPGVVSYGLADLDRATAGGARPGQLIVVGGRTGMGKSALLRLFARSFATSGIVLFASNEMTGAQIVDRDLAVYARVALPAVVRGGWTREQQEAITMAEARISQTAIHDLIEPGLTSVRLRQHAEQQRARWGLSAVVVDYLQRMADPGRTKLDQVGHAINALKSLAVTLDVPVVVGSQLNRSPDKEGGEHRPELTDLRETGEIEQTADVVLLLYRPSYYWPTAAAWKQARQPGEYPGNKASLIVAKQRQGEAGQSIDVAWLPSVATFANLSRYEEAF